MQKKMGYEGKGGGEDGVRIRGKMGGGLKKKGKRVGGREERVWKRCGEKRCCGGRMSDGGKS